MDTVAAGGDGVEEARGSGASAGNGGGGGGGFGDQPEATPRRRWSDQGSGPTIPRSEMNSRQPGASE